MTTTTAPTIRYKIYSAELEAFAADAETCEAFADRYADALSSLFAERWPSCWVDVQVIHNTTGAGSGYQGADHEDSPEDWEIGEAANYVLEEVTR